MAETPENSEHTSIKQRSKKAKAAHSANHPNQQAKTLMPFVGNPRRNIPSGLPFKLTDYLELVELTGRIIREDKRGYIEQNNPPILQRLGIEPDNWMKLTTRFEDNFKDLIGSTHSMSLVMPLLDRKQRPNIQNCKALLG